MLSDDAQKRLANIIQGIVIGGQTDYISAARNYLCASFGTSTKVEKNFEHQSAIKEKQGLNQKSENFGMILQNTRSWKKLSKEV